jgi:HEAT repeat protein
MEVPAGYKALRKTASEFFRHCLRLISNVILWGGEALEPKGIVMRVVSCLALMTAVFFFSGPCAWTQDKDKGKELETKRANTPLDGKTLYEWEKDLSNADPSIRERAISMVKFYGSAARGSAPAIIKALDDKDPAIRVNAAISLGLIGMEEKDRVAGVNGLIRCLSKDTQQIVRFQSARALERLGAAGVDVSAAAPALTLVLRSHACIEAQMAAASALGKAGWDPQKGQNRQVLLDLIAALEDRSMEVRFEALRALIQLGRPAQVQDLKQEEQALIRLTRPKEPAKVAIWAHVALLRIAERISGDKVSDKVWEKHLSEIAGFLKSRDYQSRVQAAHAFATIGREARSRIKDLMDALDDKEPNVLVFVCIALGEMGDAAERAVPALNRMKEHENEAVREAAKEAVTKITQKVKAEEPVPPKKGR